MALVDIGHEVGVHLSGHHGSLHTDLLKLLLLGLAQMGEDLVVPHLVGPATLHVLVMNVNDLTARNLVLHFFLVYVAENK